MNQSKILIAIADPTMRNLLCRLFKQQNYQIETAENSHQTIGRVNSFQPNLVILDATLTNAGHVDLYQLIRQNGGLILKLVDRKQPVDRSIEFSQFGDDFITQPFSLGYLGSRVQLLLQPERQFPNEEFDSFPTAFNDFDDFWGGTAPSPRPWNPKPQPTSDGETTLPEL